METMLALNAQDTHVTHKFTQQTVLSIHLASAGAKLTAVGGANQRSQGRMGTSWSPRMPCNMSLLKSCPSCNPPTSAHLAVTHIAS